MIPVLQVTNLSKTYPSFRKESGLGGALRGLLHRDSIKIHAVSDISFQINRGEFVGLPGPNGAGKTTTLKMLAGLVRPSAGSAIAFGEFATPERSPTYLRKIGMVMGQRNQLNPDLPAIDSFRLSEAIYDLDSSRAAERVRQCAEMFQVTDKLKIPVRRLSLGERMKLELIFSLLHEPELLFLDEPTIGLDFNASAQIRRFLKDASATLGLTVILTSHYTKDIEELCNRVILINNGTMRYDGLLRDIDPRLRGQKTISISFSSPATCAVARLKLNANPIFSGIQFGPQKSDEAKEVVFSCKVTELGATIKMIFEQIDTIAVEDLKSIERPIEEIFSELYAKGLTPP